MKNIVLIVIIMSILLGSTGCFSNAKITFPETSALNRPTNYIVTKEGLCKWEKNNDTSQLALYQGSEKKILATLNTSPGQILSDSENLYLCGEQIIYKYEAKSGTIKECAKLEAPVLGKFMLIKNEICFIDNRNVFVRYHIETESLNEYELHNVDAIDIKILGFGYANGVLYYNISKGGKDVFVSEEISTGKQKTITNKSGIHNSYLHENGNLYFASYDTLTNKSQLCVLADNHEIVLAEGDGFLVDYHFCGEWIYYSIGYCLYRMHLDGTGQEEVAMKGVYPLMFDQTIYLTQSDYSLLVVTGKDKGQRIREIGNN